MSEGPAPGPTLAGPGPSDTLVSNGAPPGAQGRVSGHFHISPRNAAEPYQPSGVSSELSRHDSVTGEAVTASQP